MRLIKRRIIPRLIASPLILIIILIAYIYQAFLHWIAFIKYGGEWVTYFNKDEHPTIKMIYEELKKTNPSQK